MSLVQARINVKGRILSLTIDAQHGYLNEPFTTSDGFEITNSAHIELGGNQLYLLGRDQGYGNVARRSFTNHSGAVQYAFKLEHALLELNKAYEEGELDVRDLP